MQVIFFWLLEDFMFHFAHRLLHWKYFYPYIHKYHHDYKVTISLAGEHSHPIDYVLASLIPNTMGTSLLGANCHLYSIIMWQFLRVSESADGHSGYDFPWSPYRWLPFTNDAAYHDFHHLHNMGNYSSVFKTWDAIFGTNKAYYKYLEEEKLKEEGKKD